MIKFMYLLALLPLTACADNSGGSSPDVKQGTFKATVGEKTYELDVTCNKFQKDKVMFTSESPANYSELKDMNGDGIVVTGSPATLKKLSLALEIKEKENSFIVNSEVTFGGASLDLDMSGNTLTGKGKMQQELSASTVPVEFTVTCQ